MVGDLVALCCDGCHQGCQAPDTATGPFMEQHSTGTAGHCPQRCTCIAPRKPGAEIQAVEGSWSAQESPLCISIDMYVVQQWCNVWSIIILLSVVASCASLNMSYCFVHGRQPEAIRVRSNDSITTASWVHGRRPQLDSVAICNVYY